MTGRNVKALFVLLITLFVYGCSHHPAPVIEREQPPPDRIATYPVADGDTLYSIAWRFGVDFKELARNNGIIAPYTIYRGQHIVLIFNEHTKGLTNTTKSTSKTEIKAVSSSTKGSTSKQAPKVKTSPSVPKKTRPQVAAKTDKRSKQTTSAKPKTPALPAANTKIRWQWPKRGKVLSRFSGATGLNKGVDIDGKLGESVTAAAAGVVVYSGSGLRGYGKLLIIKHSERFLSAYAHNSELLVKEGTHVQRGQRIAKVGSTGTTRNKLHFEIRRDGKPVDPLRYLPR